MKQKALLFRLFGCIFFAFILLIHPIFNANAITYVTSNKTTKNWTCPEMISGGYLTMDGEHVFCVEPHIIFKTGQKYQLSTSRPSYISEQLAKKLSLISYYGTSYYTDERHYAATQSLIWIELGESVADSTFKVNGISVTQEMEDIRHLVNLHDTKPSFHQETIHLKVGESIQLEDTNNVLEHYMIESVEGIEMNKSGNLITITATDSAPTSTQINLNHMVNYHLGKSLYYSIPGTSEGNGWQICAKFYVEEPVYTSFNLEIEHYEEPMIKTVQSSKTGEDQGTVTFTKKDAKTDLGLNDTVVSILMDEEYLVTQQKTNQDGVIQATFSVTYSSQSDLFEYIENYEKLSPANQILYKDTFKSYESAKEAADKQALERLTKQIEEASYTFKAVEEVPKPGYILDSSNSSMTIHTSENHVELSLTNDFETLSIELLKLDKYTQQPLKEAIYGLYAKKDIYHPDGHTGLVYPKDTLVTRFPPTDEHGIAKIDDILLGEYYVKEVTPPPNYILSTQITDVSSSTKLTLYDEHQTGRILIKKNDKETGNESQGDAKLIGAIYGLYAASDIIHPDQTSGIIHKKDSLVATFPTIDHTLTSSLENLYLGDYYIQEIEAPEGYLLSTEKTPIVLTSNNPVTETIDVFDQVIKNSISIHKFSKNEHTNVIKHLENIQFDVKLKSEVEAKGWQDASLYDRLITDINGYANSIDLPYGIYLLREANTPTNVHPISDIEVVINEDTLTNNECIEINNQPILTQIEVIKVDALNKTQQLSGATFSLFDSSKNKIETSVTNEEGKIVFENIEHGTYYLQEIKSPEGYIIDNQPIEIVIDENYNEENKYTITISNQEIVTHHTGDQATIIPYITMIVSSSLILFFLKKKRLKFIEL